MSLFDRDKSGERMPVSLITGFLGSGKTTLLNKLLRHPGMADSAVIINEFGEVGLRIIMRHPRLRTSESKDTGKPTILVWLWFRSPHDELAASMMRTSEPPH